MCFLEYSIFRGGKGRLPERSTNPTQPRLIAVDMDGTLLGETGQVSPRNLAALLAAHAAGIEVVVATGRRHAYAMRVLRPLDLPHACALISSNGAVTRTLGAQSKPGAPPKLVLGGMDNPAGAPSVRAADGWGGTARVPGAPSVPALGGRVGETVPTELIARTHMSPETAVWLCA